MEMLDNDLEMEWINNKYLLGIEFKEEFNNEVMIRLYKLYKSYCL
jgi:hypothetical protein